MLGRRVGLVVSGHARQCMRAIGACRNDALIFVAMFSVRIRMALGVITALVIALLSSTSALADGPWPNDPQGPQAKAIADLYWIMFVAAVVVLATVDGRGTSRSSSTATTSSS